MKASSLASIAVAASSTIAAAQTQLPSIFSDHMVFQQNKPMRVFGTDAPGQKVTVTIADRTASTNADQSGRWLIKVAPPKAGGPYQLVVAGSTSRTINDVLVGEVWLCSGQSNMQMSVREVMNAQQEMADAKYPQIRLYNVPNVRNLKPQDDVGAEWTACTPETIAGFSAVGYFFGRDLHQKLGVPIGLINSSWGGTAAEAWTPREELSTLPGMKETLEMRDMDQSAAWKQHGAEMTKFLAGFGIFNAGGEKEKAGWASTSFDDSGWKTMKLPTYWQNAGVMANGIMWFRKTIELPANAKTDAPATLELGGIDDFDMTFVNGVQVGKTDGDVPSFWSAPRRYTVPANVLKPGKNLITVRVVDIGGNGGFTGPATSMKLTTGVAGIGTDIPVRADILLAGDWKYQMEREISIPGDAQRPAMPAGDVMMTELYNAMIHPFEGYSMAGATWYQGETNAGQPFVYQKLLPIMIDAWRKRWDDQFAFLIVQLAGWMPDTTSPADAPGWAVFRDVQRQIAKDVPNTGLALAIDIGDKVDIHPKNKQDVGKRLALQALKITYGRDVLASGPTITSATADGSKTVLRFANTGAGLMARDGSLASNFAMQDKSGTWVWADAQIVGDTIILSHANVKTPAKVRYAWQNSPPASLYNKDNLPAVPFEVEVK